MLKGYLSLVLHAHLPFVRHSEDENFLEEKWLYEAITETYIPLIWAFENLLNDGIKFRITLSLSPPLMECTDSSSGEIFASPEQTQRISRQGSSTTKRNTMRYQCALMYQNNEKAYKTFHYDYRTTLCKL